MSTEDAFNTALRISLENTEVFPPSPWTNQDGLVSLLEECQEDDDVELVKELIGKLNNNIADEIKTNDLLFKMAETIGRNEIPGDETALSVMRVKGDTKSDGSQSIIDLLKVPLEIKANFKYGYCTTTFNEIQSLYTKGYRHFIVVDDFIGSGKTAFRRYYDFSCWKLEGATIHFYFLAGMAKAMSFCRNWTIPADCFKVMHKEISGYYSGKELLKRVWAMERLENKLGRLCGNVKLKDCAFGYNHAEALFCRKFGNIPNNVFPIFWWNKCSDGKSRIPIFRRVQDGY